MWNKLFKRKQSKISNKSEVDETKQKPSSTTKCFTFRSERKPTRDHYKLNDNFDYLEYQSEIYKRPGEAQCIFVY